MQSGYSGGGGTPDFYAVGRPISTVMANQSPSDSYRPQLLGNGVLFDPTSQIGGQTSFIGKRTLADFQMQHHNQALNSLFLRAVKTRNFQHSSPISPLSAVDFSSTMSLPLSEIQSQRLLRAGTGAVVFQQHRPIGAVQSSMSSEFPCLGFPQNQFSGYESEKNLMNHRLQELEKQLLDDEDDNSGDEVSVITNKNSEWSETIQNLMNFGQNQKPTSPSPASSTSSSASTSSGASPISGCLKSMIMEAATAISEGKPESATEILTRLSHIINSSNNSDHRLIEYMVSALTTRVNQKENQTGPSELHSLEHSASMQLLYHLSPCFKLALMAANLAILGSTIQEKESNCDKYHIVDFDIGQGGQYVNLLHALSSRQNGKKAIVKLTTLSESENEARLKKVGESLSHLGDQVGVSFKFNVVNQKLDEFTRESLGCDADESLAVNFAFKLYKMPDESVSPENPRDELLRRVKVLSPSVVTLVEQEINTNTAPFTARVAESFGYYGSLIDSLESVGNSDRVNIEEGLSRKISNSVSCEGRDRVERCEVFGKWRARMGMAGFELKPLSRNVAESLKTRLSSWNRVKPGFTSNEENGGLCFGWMGRTLTVASAWR